MGTTAAIVGASGYAGGELVRLVLGHPVAGARPAGGRQLRGPRHRGLPPTVPDASPAPRCSPSTSSSVRATAHPRLRCRTSSSSPCRTASPAGSRPQLPDSTVVLDLGADHRLRSADDWAAGYGGEYAGALALRAAGTARDPGRRARGTPHRRAGLLPDGDDPGAGAAGRRRAGRAGRPRRRRLQRYLRCRSLGQGQPARQRGDGRPLRRTRSGATSTGTRWRRPSASARCPSRRCWRRCPGASSPPAPLASAPASTRPALRDALTAAYDDEAFVHLLPEGRWPHTAATLRQQLLPPAGDPRRGRRPGGRRQRARQPGQGRRRPGRAVRQPRARAARGIGPAGDRDRAVSGAADRRRPPSAASPPRPASGPPAPRPA